MKESKCLVCENGSLNYFISDKEYDLFQCELCNLVFIDPMPISEKISEIYENPYDNANESYFTKIEKKIKRSRGRVKKIMQYSPLPSLRKRFLDVGCNGGFMVESAREVGFSAVGLDPDKYSIEWAKKNYPENKFIHGFLEDVNIGNEVYDVIYCSEVIEHTPNPNLFLSILSAALKQDGILYITTPDISHWRRTKDVKKWDAFNPPSHCVYFNPSNLTQLLNKNKLKVIWRAFSFKPGIKLIAKKE